MDKDTATALRRWHRWLVRLKELPRQGWLLRSIGGPESVADHSFAVGMLVLLSARKLGLDPLKAVAGALLHDLGEAVVGDVTPHDGVAEEDKRRAEVAAVRGILEELDDSGELLELYLDVLEGRTPEGRLVLQLDKVDMALQALRYQETQGLDPSEFLVSSLEEISSQALRELLESALVRREGPGRD